MFDTEVPLARPGRSLAGKALGRLTGRKMAATPGAIAVQPMPVLDALVAMAAQFGIAASRAQLGAALPRDDGDLAAGMVPLAMARIGLDARWNDIPGEAELLQQAFPLVAALADGGYALLPGIDASGQMRLRDACGERAVEPARLWQRLSGRVLSAGHADPVNGASEEQQRELVRRNPLLWLLGAYLGERRVLAHMLWAALLLNLCAFAIPLYMRAIYDRVIPNLAIDSLLALSFGVTIVLAFELALRKLKSSFVDQAAIRVGQAVQHRAIAAVLRARENREGRTAGQMTTAVRDIEHLSLLVPQAIATICVDLPFTASFMALIGAIGGWAVAGPVIGAALLMLLGIVTNFAMKLSGCKASRLMQARSDLIAEMSEGWPTIKANLAEGWFQRRWDIVADHLALSNRQVRHWSEVPAMFSGLLVQLVTVIVVITSVLQIKAGTMTTGALIAVVMLAGRAMVPVSATVSIFARLYQSSPQIKALAQVLRAEPERQVSDPHVSGSAMRGAIALAGAGYRFEGAGAASLENISLSIAAGEKVAVIGKSGSGKSTLLQLIAGLLPQQDGVITIDGHAIGRYAMAQLRRGLVYCAQDSAIFDTTLWQNVLLDLPEPDAAMVDRAIRCSGLDCFVGRTVEGYMRKVGPRGAALSGGQRQALLLARALIRDPAVLLLDEPTASLDITSERAVIDGLREAARDKTLVIATHRLALLELVDRVVWLEGGRIIADRPRDEVMSELAAAGQRRPPREAA